MITQHSSKRRHSHSAACCLLLAIAVAAQSLADEKQHKEPQSLAEALQRSAPKLIQTLKSLKCKNIGVLKFAVHHSQGVPSDNVGPINRRIADQLEAALCLASSDKDGLNIVRNASATAAKIPGANHLTPKGRTPLFSRKYRVAWGNQNVNVDAFLTGRAILGRDKLSLRIYGLFPNGNWGWLTQSWQIPMDATLTSEAGVDFIRRSLDGDPQVTPQHPLVEPGKSSMEKIRVSLQILYNGEEVRREQRGRISYIREPRENDKVTFILRRMDREPLAIGAVLKVNGENTLYRQRKPAWRCSKWILHPGTVQQIDGYWINTLEKERFRVLSARDSVKSEFHYGHEAGTISLVLYREATEVPNQPPQVEMVAPTELQTIQTAGFPKDPPLDLKTLQHTLRAKVAELPSRGLLANGERVQSKLDVEQRNWEAEPFATANYRYYVPRNAPLGERN